MSAFSVDDRPARRVDDVGGRLHQAEFLARHHAARAVAELDVDGDDVGVAEQVLLGGVVDARLLALLSRQVRAPRDHLHAERLGDAGDAQAELAEPDDAERLALDVGPERDLPRLAAP